MPPNSSSGATQPTRSATDNLQVSSTALANYSKNSILKLRVRDFCQDFKFLDAHFFLYFTQAPIDATSLGNRSMSSEEQNSSGVPVEDEENEAAAAEIAA